MPEDETDINVWLPHATTEQIAAELQNRDCSFIVAGDEDGDGEVTYCMSGERCRVLKLIGHVVLSMAKQDEDE